MDDWKDKKEEDMDMDMRSTDKFKSFKEVKDKVTELAGRYETTHQAQRKIRRLMQDKFAARIYRMIDDPVDRLNLLDGFLQDKDGYMEDRKRQDY